jgi:hypothetical protein
MDMNFRRILLGGFLAGVIYNIVEIGVNGAILGTEWKAWQTSLGSADHPPAAGVAMGLWTLVGFGWGFVGAWLYAALRPRFGPGPKTAILTGLTLWIIGWLLNELEQVALGDIPHILLVGASIAGLVASLIAMLVAGSVYRESTT